MHLSDCCLCPLCQSSPPSVCRVDSAPVCAPVWGAHWGTVYCLLSGYHWLASTPQPPNWFPVPCVCTVDSALVCPCLTGFLCPLYVHLTGNQPDRGHTGALSTVHTEGTDNQPDWGPLGHCQLYIQRALITRPTGDTHSGALSTVHREGIDNQSDRGHTVGHCQLYIQRAQTTSQTGDTQWGTVGQSTVHSDGTDQLNGLI